MIVAGKPFLHACKKSCDDEKRQDSGEWRISSKVFCN
jgi:hypothetical protein